MRAKFTHVLIFVAGVFAVFLDQILKLENVSSVQNSGVAFGLKLGNVSWLIQLVVMIVMVMVILRLGDLFLRSGLILILIISTSNLYDRLALGYVIDYWQLAGIWLNLSDMLISLVVAIMLLNYLKLSYGNSSSSSRGRAST